MHFDQRGALVQNGVDLNLGPLLIFCALFGCGGPLISLFRLHPPLDDRIRALQGI